MNDNRNYSYGKDNQTCNRHEYLYIQRWVTEGAKVIDLGCGNGSLLSILKEKKGITEFGIEISESGVNACRTRGINARTGRIDVELTDIEDSSFDYAVCNVTIQMVMYPETLLKEMKRISKYQIISFPNFAYIFNRIELLLYGRMPRKLLGGYSWHDTGHIHQFSIKDFKDTISNLTGLKINKSHYYGGLGKLNIMCPNLLASSAIFMTELR